MLEKKRGLAVSRSFIRLRLVYFDHAEFDLEQRRDQVDLFGQSAVWLSEQVDFILYETQS